MILLRILQVVACIALAGCALLALQATPLGTGWHRARLLYAAAGAIPALTLLGIAAQGFALRRQARELKSIKTTLARIEDRLGN